MATKYTDLPAAGPLDGSEILAIVQGGNSKQTTTQDIADLGPGGPGGSVESVTGDFIDNTDPANPVMLREVNFVTVATAGGTLDLDFGGSVSTIFYLDASFATAKAVTISNDSYASRFEFLIDITNVAATLDFGAGTTFESDDPRFDEATQLLTFKSIGAYTIHGTFDGLHWRLFIMDAKEPLRRIFRRETASTALVLSDADGGIEMNVGSANDVEVPLFATVPFLPGTLIPVIQYGAGLTSITKENVSITINTSAGNLDSPGQNAPMFLRNIAADEWYLWNGTPASGGSAASETVAGIAEIATQAEVTTGTDDTRIVSPLKLAVAVPASSETAAGKIEIATQAEVATGTDDVRAVTPLKLATETRGVQDLFISAAAMWPRTTGPCADLAKTEMATSLFNIQSLDFDQTTQEFCQFQIVLPRKYNNGTVTAVFYWTASAGSGDVQWGISGGAYSNDDALTVALGSAQTVDDTLIATNDLHITSATSAITLAGTPADADFLAFQISRNPASDTLTADAKLLGVSIRVTVDSAKDA